MRPRSLVVVGAAALTLLAGCTSTRVHPIDRAQHSLADATVCIETNYRVTVRAMPRALEDAFRRNDIKTEFRDASELDDCPYVLRYTAHRWWNILPYTSRIELELFHESVAIGSARFRAGEATFTKFARTYQKTEPLVDRMLARPPGPQQRTYPPSIRDETDL